jgi:hypothetical protein
VKRTTAATGFDDVAQCEAVFNETGVPMGERFLGLNTRDYNGMANNLATRQTMAGRPEVAYGKALVGRDIAGFDILKMDTAYRQAARTATGVTINGTQRYVPAATTTAGTGQRDNVDNRYMNLNVTVTSGTIQVGDCFTITGVNNVHQITKVDTGQLKTFRVTAIVSGGGGTGTIQISPPIISADSSPTQSEIQYKNVSAAAANGVSMTFLNTVSTLVNPFWRREALELIPGTVEYDPQAGWAVVNGTTDKNGMKVTMLKQGDINTGLVKYRLDCKFGVVLKAPEQSGIMLFGQT